MIFNEMYPGGAPGGTFATGTFTADGPEIVFYFTTPQNVTQFNALQLRDVTATPEPGSLTMAVLIPLLGLWRKRSDVPNSR